MKIPHKKYKHLFLFFLILWQTNVLSQCTGDFVINTLASYNALLENECEVIDGNLQISASTVPTLLALSNLHTIKGDLKITSNTLENLHGLENLTRIEGSIILEECYNLSSLTGLGNLDFLGNSLIIKDNPKLHNLIGFPPIETIPGDLSITFSPQFINFEGLENLTQIEGSFNVIQSDAITNFSGLENLHLIGGDLRLEYNDSLQNFTGLENLSTLGIYAVPGGLHVRANNMLNSFEFPLLEKIYGDIVIEFSSGLLDLNGFEALKSLQGGIEIFANANLSSISGLNNLNEIIGDINIPPNNALLESITGFKNLKRIGGDLRMSAPILTNITGFSTLEEILGGFYVAPYIESINLSGFPQLKSVGLIILPRHSHLPLLESLSNLEHIRELHYINGFTQFAPEFSNPLSINEIYITGNDSLQSISGFGNLVQVEKIEIDNNSILEQVNGFLQLTSADRIFINSNSLLSNVRGFESLNSIETLRLKFNNNLENITGFNNLKSCGELIIEDSGLTHIDHFPELSYIGQFKIKRNSYLTHLIGPDQFERIDKIEIENSYDLRQISGFNNIDSTDIKITICNIWKIDGFNQVKTIKNLILENTGIKDLSGFSNLENAVTIKFTGDLIKSRLSRVDWFPKLKNLETLEINTINTQAIRVDGFNKIRSLNQLIITENNISRFYGFNKLHSIYGELTIEDNKHLDNIYGFEGLRQIGKLNISNNELLEDFTNFPKLLLIKDSLIVQGNNSLSNCCQLPCLSELTEGPTIIEGNTYLCNSLASLEESCTNSLCPIKEANLELVTSKPNPCSENLTIELNAYFDNLDLTEVQVWIPYQVVDMTGRLLLNGKFLYSPIPNETSNNSHLQLNVAHLSPGIYGLKLIHPQTQEVLGLRFVKE